MKLCKDCRFCWDSSYCVRESILRHEQAERAAPTISPVTGERVNFVRSFSLGCSAYRERTDGKCGMKAKFFEPISG